MQTALALPAGGARVRHTACKAHIQPQPLTLPTAVERRALLWNGRQGWRHSSSCVAASALASTPSALEAPFEASPAVVVDRDAVQGMMMECIASLQSSDAAAQAHAAVQLASLTAQPMVMDMLAHRFLWQSGAVAALSQALHSDFWEVTGNAAISLAALVRSVPHIALVMPADDVIPELVAMLQQLQHISCEELRVECAGRSPVELQCAAVTILAALSHHHQHTVAASGAIPLVVELLYVDNNSTGLCMRAAEALQGIAKGQRAYKSAIANEGAIVRLMALLNSDDACVLEAAAGALVSIVEHHEEIQAGMTIDGNLTELLRKRKRASDVHYALNCVLRAMNA